MKYKINKLTTNIYPLKINNDNFFLYINHIYSSQKIIIFKQEYDYYECI